MAAIIRFFSVKSCAFRQAGQVVGVREVAGRWLALGEEVAALGVGIDHRMRFQVPRLPRASGFAMWIAPTSACSSVRWCFLSRPGEAFGTVDL